MTLENRQCSDAVSFVAEIREVCHNRDDVERIYRKWVHKNRALVEHWFKGACEAYAWRYLRAEYRPVVELFTQLREGGVK